MMKNSKYYRLKRVSDKNKLRLDSIKEVDRLSVKKEITARMRLKESDTYRKAYNKLLEDYNKSSIIVKIYWRIGEVFEWLCEKLYRI